eukprot:5169888-Pleurochrysis_carterae.AAC.2
MLVASQGCPRMMFGVGASEGCVGSDDPQVAGDDARRGGRADQRLLRRGDGLRLALARALPPRAAVPTKLPAGGASAP